MLIMIDKYFGQLKTEVFGRNLPITYKNISATSWPYFEIDFPLWSKKKYWPYTFSENVILSKTRAESTTT